MILRRLFLYLVSAAGLGLLTAGLASLGSTALLFVFNNQYAQDSRTQLAIFTAMTLVALPVWGIAFWFAHRFAMRDPNERASAIRHLYLYWACLVASIGALVALAITGGDLLRPLIDTCSPVVRARKAPYNCPANQTGLQRRRQLGSPSFSSPSGHSISGSRLEIAPRSARLARPPRCDAGTCTSSCSSGCSSC